MVDMLYMQSCCVEGAMVVQRGPSAHRGCAVNHRCITLRIDTSGGSVNCSDPVKKGWMCGSSQGYYIVQSIK